jgi:hypothetical protein
MLPDNSGPNVTMATNAVDVMLGPADIPGADLNEPFETHVVPALRWWLLCRGIGSSSSSRKQQLQAVTSMKDSLAVSYLVTTLSCVRKLLFSPG